MARYLVSSEHTEEDCVRALDSVLAISQQLMARFDWGCKDGDHRGWVVVEAQDKNTAKMLLPTFIRDKAQVVALTKFTPEDVKSFHDH
ncbi:MAG TPA: hypothetical protein VI759_06120 [Dehalococcoidia bacterium]|nr:hypothetical protein [Dehalococcoidia bacterium]